MIWTFHGIENVYRGEDCMKKFSVFLRKHAIKIINLEKKKKIPVTQELEESYEKTKICYICKKKF